MRRVPLTMQRQVYFDPSQNARFAYTATVKEIFEQTLMDGNRIHWNEELVEARDEAGRTMRQQIYGCELDDDGQPQLHIQTIVSDPATKSFTAWGVGPGTLALAFINRQPQPPTPQPPPSFFKDIPRTPSPSHKEDITSEDLGTRTIAGMQATGLRLTQIIPAGAEGNDVPLKVVHETWTNRLNHVTLLAIDDDPRTGHVIWEVESLTVGPPNPALFAPPASYKIWDERPQPQTTADAKQ